MLQRFSIFYIDKLGNFYLLNVFIHIYTREKNKKEKFMTVTTTKQPKQYSLDLTTTPFFKVPTKKQTQVSYVPFVSPESKAEAEQESRQRAEAVKGEILFRTEEIKQKMKKAGLPIKELEYILEGNNDEKHLQKLRSIKIYGKTIQYVSDFGEKVQETYNNNLKAVKYFSGMTIPDRTVSEFTDQYGNKCKQTSFYYKEHYQRKYKDGHTIDVYNAYSHENLIKTPNGTYRETYIWGDGAGDSMYCATRKFYNPQGKEISKQEYDEAISSLNK